MDEEYMEHFKGKQTNSKRRRQSLSHLGEQIEFVEVDAVVARLSVLFGDGGRPQQFLLQVERNVPALSVVFDELLKRVAVRHPSDDSAVVGEGHDAVALDGEAPLGGGWVVRQERVDQPERHH